MGFSEQSERRIAAAVAKVERMVRNLPPQRGRWQACDYTPPVRFLLSGSYSCPKYGVINSREGRADDTEASQTPPIIIGRPLDYLYRINEAYVSIERDRDVGEVGRCANAHRKPCWAYWAKNLHSYPVNLLCGPIPDTAGADYRFQMGPWLPGGFRTLNACPLRKYEDDPERWASQVVHVDSLAPLWCQATGPWTRGGVTCDNVEVRPCSEPTSATGAVSVYNGTDVFPTYGTDALPDITFDVRIPLVGTKNTATAPTTRDPNISTGQVFQYRLMHDRQDQNFHFVVADASVYDDPIGTVKAWTTYDAATGAPNKIPAGWEIYSTGKQITGFDATNPLYRPMGQTGSLNYEGGASQNPYAVAAWIRRIANT